MSGKPKVLVTRLPPPGGLEELQDKCDLWVWKEDDNMPREELLKRVVGIDGLYFHAWNRLDKELLDAAGPQLKVIATMSVGLEHVDLEECKRRGLPIGYTPGLTSGSVAELTVGLLLATTRRFKEGVSTLRDGEYGRVCWNSGTFMCGHDIQGSTVGIVGLGNIGFGVAKRLVGFDVAKFVYCGHTRKPYDTEIKAEFVSFDDLLQQSDFVIACCAVNDSNKGMFDKNAFKKMKETAVFINITRGDLVNQDDLYDALVSGQIFAAGLDVITPDPLLDPTPPEHPLVNLPNCLITPHIGSATMRSRRAMSILTSKNILAGLNNEPLPSPAI